MIGPTPSPSLAANAPPPPLTVPEWTALVRVVEQAAPDARRSPDRERQRRIAERARRAVAKLAREATR